MSIRKIVVEVTAKATTSNYAEHLKNVYGVAYKGETHEGMKILSDVTGYVGQVLSKRTVTERVMSDVWEDATYYLVWTGKEAVEIGRSGALGYGKDGINWLPGMEQPEQKYGEGVSYEYHTDIVVDATPEVTAKYAEWQHIQDEIRNEKQRVLAETRRLEEEEKEKHAVRYGKVVRVVRGRKVPIGTQGTVIWVGDGRFGERLGIATSENKDANGKYTDVAWTALSNVEVVLAEESPKVEAIETVAQEVAQKVEVVAPVAQDDLVALVKALTAKVDALTSQVAELSKPKNRKVKSVR